MRKVINVKPVTEMVLDFGEESGIKPISLLFDMEALSIIQGLEGGLQTIADTNILEVCAVIIHAGSKGYVSREDAKKYALNMSLENAVTIISEFTNSVGIVEAAVKDDMVKKVMAQFLDGKMA